MNVTIEHTAATGTLVEGTSRGDGSAPILKGLGWRWGRSIGCWFAPRSRDTAPNVSLIERTAQALRADGVAVEVSIDATPRTTAEVEADKITRAADRAQELAAKASRLDDQADATYARAREMASHIPFGQPILADHYSAGRDRRTRDRISSIYDKSFQLAHDAEVAHRAADAAAAHTGARYSVTTVGNRIQSLTADLRRAERAGRASQVSELAEQLAYWQGIRSQQLADGTAGDFGSHTIKAGDIVQCGRAWYVVERASAKSVTLRGDFGPRRVAYHKLSGHRATPNSSPRD